MLEGLVSFAAEFHGKKLFVQMSWWNGIEPRGYSVKQYSGSNYRVRIQPASYQQ